MAKRSTLLEETLLEDAEETAGDEISLKKFQGSWHDLESQLSRPPGELRMAPVEAVPKLKRKFRKYMTFSGLNWIGWQAWLVDKPETGVPLHEKIWDVFWFLFIATASGGNIYFSIDFIGRLNSNSESDSDCSATSSDMYEWARVLAAVLDIAVPSLWYISLAVFMQKQTVLHMLDEEDIESDPNLIDMLYSRLRFRNQKGVWASALVYVLTSWVALGIITPFEGKADCTRLTENGHVSIRLLYMHYSILVVPPLMVTATAVICVWVSELHKIKYKELLCAMALQHDGPSRFKERFNKEQIALKWDESHGGADTTNEWNIDTADKYLAIHHQVRQKVHNTSIHFQWVLIPSLSANIIGVVNSVAILYFLAFDTSTPNSALLKLKNCVYLLNNLAGFLAVYFTCVSTNALSLSVPAMAVDYLWWKDDPAQRQMLVTQLPQVPIAFSLGNHMDAGGTRVDLTEGKLTWFVRAVVYLTIVPLFRYGVS